MSPPMLPPAFQALETRLSDLQARYQRGELDAGGYQAAVQELKVKDSSGRTWWLGGEAGAWQVWDGKAWVWADPQVSGVQGGRAAKPRGKGSIRPFTLGCGVGVFLLALVVGIFLIVGWQAYQEEAKIVELQEPITGPTTPYVLSEDQASVIDQHGYPQAFVILFYDEEGATGALSAVRFETWTYYTASREFTFINGGLDGEDTIEFDLEGEILPIPYQPEQFVAYMSLDEVLGATGLSLYMVIPLEKEVVPGGEVYYADELAFGLKDDELRYVEALALLEGE